MEGDSQKHSRFRFGLRTLFVLLTALAVWLGWNVYQVRQRTLMEQYVSSIPSRIRKTAPTRIVYGPPLKPWKSLPYAWRVLGVKTVQSIELRDTTVPDEDREHIERWFPEADIYFGD